MASAPLDSSPIPERKSCREPVGDEYEQVFQTVLKELVEDPELTDISVIVKRMEKMVNYNVKDVLTKRTLSRIFLEVYQTLKGTCTENDMHLAYILAWNLEFFQGLAMMADDISDKGITRRGTPCWYLLADVGDHAVNDVVLMEQLMYQILAKYFKGTDYYVELVELFHNTTYKIALGQSLDIRISKNRDYQQYNLEEYFVLIKYKSGLFFHLPIQMAFIHAGKAAQYQPSVQSIILELGIFLQIWNDYAAVFGDFEIKKNVSTDIAEGKCTWLFLTAKKILLDTENDDKNKELAVAHLYDNYGVDDVSKVRWVEELYRGLRLDDTFAELREVTRDSLNEAVDKIADPATRAALRQMITMAFEKVERN